MLCFAFGALGLAGLFAFARHRRRHRLCGGYYGRGYGLGPFGHHRRHHHDFDDYGIEGGVRRRGRFLFELFRRIDASPAQERAIARMVEGFRPHIDHARSELTDVRRDLAAALAGSELDEQAVAAIFERSGALFTKLNGELKDAFVSLHTTLDDEQRSLLAKLIGRGRVGPSFYQGPSVAL